MSGSTATPTDTAPAPANGPVITNTADGGVLVGTDPRPNPQNTFTQVNPGNHTNTATVGPVFTAEQIQKARQEEKDKLYPQIQTMQAELAELKKARDEQLEAEKKAREEAEAALKAERESEMSAKELLEQQKAEFEARFQALQQEREQERQVLEMERRYQELQAYRAQAIAANADKIVPELVDLVTGNTPEEIDVSIAGLVERSNRIVEQMQAAAQAARAGMRGAPVTAPPVGPLDTNSDQNSAWDAAQNGSLSFEDYVKNRDKLIASASASRQRGLFG